MNRTEEISSIFHRFFHILHVWFAKFLFFKEFTVEVFIATWDN